MALPAEGLTLADKQVRRNDSWSSAPRFIELNTVRKHLSAIKGGWLAAANAGSTLTLGAVRRRRRRPVVDRIRAQPCPIPRRSDEALAVLDAHGGRDALPGAGRRAAEARHGRRRRARRRSRATAAWRARSARVIGGGRTAVEGARTAAASLGYMVHVVDRPIVGEARNAACELLQTAAQSRQSASLDAAVCIVPPVKRRCGRPGRARAGGTRNARSRWRVVSTRSSESVVAASVGTDGIDGPTDAAGAIVDSTTLARAEAADIGPPERYLEEHNSYIFFDELGDLIRTGPTGTNVGDLQVILVGSGQ